MRESRPEQIILRRVLERMYDRRIIGNVERRTYVELMIELALERLRPRWWAADTWHPWTLEQAETGARIAVRQSAALQTWSASAIASLPEFDIAPRNGYYVDGGSQWVEVQPPQRPADIYVVAYHGEVDESVADQRLPEQWEFYVAVERDLPPGQKRIGLNRFRAHAEECGFEELAGVVARAAWGLRRRG